MEEFSGGDGGRSETGSASDKSAATSLADKLEDRAARLGSDAG